MNRGTKIRTALAIAVSIHTALIATDVTGFSNPTVDTIYKAVSILVNFVVVALTTYYNQDYTEEACQGTGYTRWLKQHNAGDTHEDLSGEEVSEDGEEL